MEYSYSKTQKLSNEDILLMNSLSELPIEQEVNRLEHLRLILTNKCNLNCIYCYANGGTYNEKLADMSYETIVNSINYFYSSYEYIHQISFFGGEPLLKIDLINQTCEYVVGFCEQNHIKLPIFSMVTNGVLIDDKAIEIIDKFKIQTNLSLDGPKDFNDRQRIFSDKDRSVFEIVDYNAKKLRKKIKFSVESTCTNIINEYGYSFDDIQNFFRKRYLIDRVNVAAAMIVNDVDSDLELKGEKEEEKSLSKIVNRFFRKDHSKYAFNDIIIRLLNTYFSNYYCASFCDAGLKQYTIAMNGDIYPCQLFFSSKENKLGNINNLINKEMHLFQRKYKKEFDKCKKCGYRRFCQTCLCKVDEIERSDNYCLEVKKGVDLFIQNMLDLKENNRKEYGILLKEYKEFYENIL